MSKDAQPGAHCRYIISGSEGVCQHAAQFVVTTLRNRYPMPVCEDHAKVFMRSGNFLVKNLPFKT